MNYKARHEPHFLLWISFSTMCSHCSNNIGLFGSSPMDLHTFFFCQWHPHSRLSHGFFFLFQTPYLAFFSCNNTRCPQISNIQNRILIYHLSNSALLPGFSILENGTIFSKMPHNITLGVILVTLCVSFLLVQSSWQFCNLCSSLYLHYQHTTWNYHAISPGKWQKLLHRFLLLPLPHIAMGLSQNMIRLYYSFLLKILKWLSVSWK